MRPAQHLTEIGAIQRTHGINGELQIAWGNDFYFEDTQLESVFVEIDGIPIPFFIGSIRPKGADRAIVKLDDIDTIQAANELVGLKLLLPTEALEQDNELELKDLVGYTLLSSQNEQVGVIDSYEEYPNNALYSVLHPSGRTVIVPAAVELVVEVDPGTRTVIMDIADGLVGLYLG